MKLPELKEKLKSKYIVRVVAGVLTIALVVQESEQQRFLQRRTAPQSQPRQTAQQEAVRMLMT